ncbi:uncharacterized protein EMH_0092290 [Eimeria mitis]|uniref:Uncharacterized protein n=1 Tax=Eimeria mitis TaxID=44415 RepID=U6KK32_9EIME|nr:uncharacterized protein EMH_0092290 [Eimeria mitis]CDJ36632.1 hypothetical protein EMH_0092290 [Eimeria mitis]
MTLFLLPFLLLFLLLPLLARLQHQKGRKKQLHQGEVLQRRHPSCQDSGREVFAEAVESPSSLPHGSDAGQLFSAASDAPCGSLVPTGAAALARPTPTAAEAGRAAAEGFASPPGEQDPVNSPSCIKLGPRTLGSVGSVKQQQRGKGPAAGSNEADSPTAAAITATENPLGTAVQHLCGSVGSALATAVPAAGAYSKGDPSNSSRATSGTAAAAAQQQNSHRSANPFKAPVAGDTYQLLPFETPQPGPHPDTTHFDASSTTAATVATATPAMPDSAATGAKCVTATAAEAAGDSAIPGPSAASLLNVPAIRSYAASVFADRAAVLQEVELLQQDMRSAASAFRSAADELLSAAAETREALSALLDEQQELTAVHTRAFAAVATAAPAPPIAYSRFAPQQLRALAAEQEAAMEELQQLEQQQRALTKEQRQAWTKHCRQQLQLLCTCLRGRLRLRQYHEQGLACSGKAQRVNAALLQLRRLYACPDAFAAAARETVRRLVFAASFRKAAETARAVLQRMQQQEQQQRLHFLESAAVSLPAAVFWPLLQVAPQEAHVTLPETEEPLTSIIGPAALAATIEEAQQQKQGVEQDQQQRQQQEDRMLLRALLRSELARTAAAAATAATAATPKTGTAAAAPSAPNKRASTSGSIGGPSNHPVLR